MLFPDYLDWHFPSLSCFFASKEVVSEASGVNGNVFSSHAYLFAYLHVGKYVHTYIK